MVYCPRFSEIPTPNVVGLFVGNGTGSKLLQAHLDGAPELYMLAAYPLIYFYPHWNDWKIQNGTQFTWERIIDLFCQKHGSVIDTRRLPGFNGLRSLGPNRDEYLAIEEAEFRALLSSLLADEPVIRRTFLLAVHYAYAMCQKEEMAQKTTLLYHLHNWQYLHFLLEDFPSSQVIAMTRDPRSNYERRISACYNVDADKLTATDAALFRMLPPSQTVDYIANELQHIAEQTTPEQARVVRHEDLGTNLEATLWTLCQWLAIPYQPEMLTFTFGGKQWWGDPVYTMPPSNTFFSRVLSKSWQRETGVLELFVMEGIVLDVLQFYGYTPTRYLNDDVLHRILLTLGILIPLRVERAVLWFYLHPRQWVKFVENCLAEARGKLPIKDYTANSTTRYKWMYRDLKLWQTRPHVRVLLKHPNSLFAKILYVAGQMFRYIFAILRLPYWYGKTRTTMFQRLQNRIRERDTFPQPL